MSGKPHVINSSCGMCCNMLRDQHGSDRIRKSIKAHVFFHPSFNVTSGSLISLSTTDLLNAVWKKISHDTYEHEKLLKSLYH